MNQINWEKDDLDDHPVYAGQIAAAVINLADCVEMFLPHERAKSIVDPRVLAPDVLWGPETAYNAAVSVEELINPMLEEYGCIGGTMGVFAPLFAIRKEMWSLYELQGWNDLPIIQIPAVFGTAISSQPLPSNHLSAISHRLRLSARILSHAVGNSATTADSEAEKELRKKLKLIVTFAKLSKRPRRIAEFLAVNPCTTVQEVEKAAYDEIVEDASVRAALGNLSAQLHDIGLAGYTVEVEKNSVEFTMPTE
jgi:hypothetical protein